MSYNKTTWNTGDVITADKLNNIETGLSTLTDSYIIDIQAPSDQSIDLTVGASRTLYEAPADGYFACGVRLTSGSGNASLTRNGSILDMNKMSISAIGTYSDLTVPQCFIPVKKGDQVEFQYFGSVSTKYLKFYYLNGNKEVS